MRKEFIFNLIFGLVNVVVMVIVVIFARGYNYNLDTNKLERQGTLTVESEPNGAGVYINDEFIGNTPLQKTSVKPGTYSLKVKQNDYFDLNTNVEIIDNYVTKRYYKLIKNKQQLLPIVANNLVSYSFSDDGSNLIYIEKADSRAYLSYLNFDKSAIDIALGQENTYLPKVISSNLITLSNNFEIIASFDGSQGVIKGTDGKTLQYFKTETNFITVDLLKIIGFTPDNIFFNKYNNLVINKSSDYYYFDTNTKSLSLKATFNETQNIIINNGIYIIEKDKLQVATSSNTINEYKELVLPFEITKEEIASKNVYLDEDLDGNIFVSVKNKGSFGLSKNDNIIQISSKKDFNKSAYRLKNNVYISNDLTQLLEINYTLGSTNLINQQIGGDILFAKSRDFIIFPDYSTKTLKMYDDNFQLIKNISLELGIKENLSRAYLTKSDDIILISKDTSLNTTSISKLIF